MCVPKNSKLYYDIFIIETDQRESKYFAITWTIIIL
jgi:hypothetical protein